MHILQLARRFVREDWGGTETVVLQTGKRLIAMGHQTEIYCTMATAKTPSDDLDGLKVSRYRHFYPYIGLSESAKQTLDKRGGSPISFPLMRAIKALPNLDIIHLHTGNRIGGIARHVALQRKIPYVASLHGGVFDVPEEERASLAAPTKGALDLGKAFGWWVGSRRIMDDASAILCVGYSESQLAQKNFPNKRVIYTPNGVDSQRFSVGDGNAFRRKYGLPLDAYLVLTVARIDHQKNQKLPVEALPELLAIEPRTHLLLIGNVANMEYHDELVRKAEALGVRGNLTIIPGIPVDNPDIVNAYHAADVFLLPSIHEPFGIVVLEAWAAKRPVLASRVGGIPHFVEDGKDGQLFEPRDRASFLEAFSALCRDRQRAQSFAEAGYRKASGEYDWTTITRGLVGIYEECIRENSLRQ